jgi:ankyrin repeat protein
MISRCSEARERTVNRSERSSEMTTDDTIAGYRRTPATSIDAMRTVFLVGTVPATEDDSLAAIKLAAEAGVDLDAFNVNGDTALHRAAARGADSIVAYLADRGAGSIPRIGADAHRSTSRSA